MGDSLTYQHGALPFITVCMPTRNEAMHIRPVLRDILAQDYPRDRFEIIVADACSRDGTPEIVAECARGHPQVRLQNNPRYLASAGRNIGFRIGHGSVFLVVDAHCRIQSTTMFRDIANLLGTTGANCLSRPQPLDPPGNSPFQRGVALARSCGIGHARNSLIYSNQECYVSPVSHGAIYTRTALERVGYYDEDFDACEDLDYNYRVHCSGLRAFMSPQLTVQYSPRGNLPALSRQVARYGRGRVRFILKHPEALTLDMLVAPLPGLALLSLPFLGLVSPALARLAILPHAAYLFAMSLWSLALSIRRRYRHFYFLPPIFAVIHYGFSFGFLLEMLRRGHLAALTVSALNQLIAPKVRRQGKGFG